jgi:hypothetical protein
MREVSAGNSQIKIERASSGALFLSSDLFPADTSRLSPFNTHADKQRWIAEGDSL